ncbi:hypothetical protein ACWED2_46400 [Amycolatopsis sp. NPDC005003]
MGSRFAKTIHAHIGRDPGFAPDPPRLRLHPVEYAAATAVRPGLS